MLNQFFATMPHCRSTLFHNVYHFYLPSVYPLTIFPPHPTINVQSLANPSCQHTTGLSPHPFWTLPTLLLAVAMKLLKSISAFVIFPSGTQILVGGHPTESVPVRNTSGLHGVQCHHPQAVSCLACYSV